MKIQLSDHFTFSRLERFVLPSVVMMIFTSIYSVIDGVFVSNFVGKTAFAAVNLVMPVIMSLASVGFMAGTGGSALVAMFLGAGKNEKANAVFSLLIYTALAVSIVLCALAGIFMRTIVEALGADGELLEKAVLYARILLVGGTAFVLQNMFQSFLVVAEKPTFGLKLTVAAGLTNMILDALFIAVFRWGIAGAALATVASVLVGGGMPFVYFLLPNKTKLRLGKTKFDLSPIAKTAANGSSELVGNLAMSVVSILYNFQLIRIAGETGIAAYGSLMYVSFIFAAVFLGYGIGRSPIVSYHYGAGNTAELKNLFRKDCAIIGSASVFLAILSEMLSKPLAALFGGYDENLFLMIRRAFALYSPAFLIMGANLAGSSFFTALNNGFVSALISFLRTLLFQIAAVLVLPRIFGLDGIWLSGIVSELCAFCVVAVCFCVCRKKYGYA